MTQKESASRRRQGAENRKEEHSMWRRFREPVLIVSTRAGRGMYSVGEAIRERLPGARTCEHICIEDFLPRDRVDADLER